MKISKLEVLSNDESLNKVCLALLKAFSKSAAVLRHCTTTAHKMESQNEFGDQQLDMDVICEKSILDELKSSGQVTYALSEETPQPIKLNDEGKWIVTFDPLDGSSIIGSNFSIGAICAIWPHGDNILIGDTGRDCVSACCCLYGSRTSVLFYNQITDGVDEYTLQETGSPNEYWKLTKSSIKIKEKANMFSPGNTRCMGENPPYQEVVDHWLHTGYTLRYSGGMAADIYQIFMREEGVFSCMGTDKHPSKLRYIYEVAPLAFLVEKGGGATTTGSKPILDQKVENYIQRSQITVGSLSEINFVEAIYDKWYKKLLAVHQ